VSRKEKTWKEIPRGVPPPTLIHDWGLETYMPVRLRKCTVCYLRMFCPEGAIMETRTWKIEFNSFVKDRICANECPTKAITMKWKRSKTMQKL
jgi:Pyruvate/2-oxoacid:ferredoxin oxidoreductase delta subunit